MIMEISLGMFLGNWIPAKISKAAANAGVCSVKDGVYSFRVHKSVGFIGAALLLIAACAAFMPYWIIQVIWLAVFLPIALPVMLFALVPKISIDEEKIVYRNRVGIRTQILWRDVRCAYTTTIHGSFMVRSQTRRILVTSYICCHPQLRSLSERYCPGAFSVESVMSVGCIPEIYSSDGALYFSQQRFLLRAPVLLLLLTLCSIIPLFIFTPGFEHGDIYMILLIMLLPIIILLMLFIVPRVRLDDKSICYRNAIGISRCIEWREVKSVETVSATNTQYIKVSDSRKYITVSRAFCRYDAIKELIMNRVPTTARRIRKE